MSVLLFQLTITALIKLTQNFEHPPLEIGGYFPRDGEIEKTISQYNDEYPNATHMKSNLLKTFAIIEDLALPLDSIWFRKSCFFTLVVETCQNLGSLPDDFAEKLQCFDNEIFYHKNDTESDHGIFYSYMYSGTTGRKARVERGRIFRQHVLGHESN